MSVAIQVTKRDTSVRGDKSHHVEVTSEQRRKRAIRKRIQQYLHQILPRAVRGGLKRSTKGDEENKKINPSENEARRAKRKKALDTKRFLVFPKPTRNPICQLPTGKIPKRHPQVQQRRTLLPNLCNKQNHKRSTRGKKSGGTWFP